MAYRATNVIQSDGYLRSKRTAEQLKVNLDGFIADMQVTNTDYARLQAIYDTLVRADASFDELASIPGIAQYARDQEDDQTYDAVAEAQAMRNEIDSAISWMDTNTIVTNRTLKPPAEWLNARTIVADEFTPAEIQPLINRLTQVSNTIV